MNLLIVLPEFPWPIDLIEATIRDLLARFQPNQHIVCCHEERRDFYRLTSRWPDMADADKEIRKGSYDLCAWLREVPSSVELMKTAGDMVILVLGSEFPEPPQLERLLLEASITASDKHRAHLERLMPEPSRAGSVLALVDRTIDDTFDLRRAIGSIENYFGQRPTLALDKANASNLPRLLTDHFPVIDPETAYDDCTFGNWVVITDIDTELPGAALETVKFPGTPLQRAGKRMHLCDNAAFVNRVHVSRPGSPKIVAMPSDNPQFGETYFSAQASHYSRAGFYFFPFNTYSFFTSLGQGPANTFGHRTETDILSLGHRDANHKVIAIFGGSAAYSTHCLYEESFGCRLQQALNRLQTELTFTVVNLAAPGHTIINEMIAYSLFGYHLRPDIVIAHDGFNDLYHGLIADARLVRDYHMTYMLDLEQWSRQLHGTSYLPTTQPTDGTQPYRMTNDDASVVAAYIGRKKQFMETVRQNGQSFIWALQPLWFSKRPSRGEASAIQRHAEKSIKTQPIFQRIPKLYAMAVEQAEKLSPELYIDLHRAFEAYGEQDNLFVDHVHMLPDGDRRIADIYATFISEKLVKGDPSASS